MTLTVGSLFSGIGGIDLGLERAGHSVIWQSEIAAYPARILARHWPDTPNLGDIKAIDWNHVERPDIIAGGYPCPAFSQAARGRNVAENLWPWMRDAIADLRPRYVILENVAAHLGRGFADTLDDLHAIGFDAEWEVLTACAAGATHTRRRLFCVAYPHRDGQSVQPFHAQVAGMPSTAADRRDRWHATPDDVGTDDGVPHRMDRLRALGNAVVPAIAEMIGRNLEPTAQQAAA